MAKRSVVLYQRTKIKKKWAYRKVAKAISALGCGEYYMRKTQASGLGRIRSGSCHGCPREKRLELAYVATGDEVKYPDNKKSVGLAYVAAGGEIKQNGHESPEQTGIASHRCLNHSRSKSILRKTRFSVRDLKMRVTCVISLLFSCG